MTRFSPPLTPAEQAALLARAEICESTGKQLFSDAGLFYRNQEAGIASDLLQAAYGQYFAMCTLYRQAGQMSDRLGI